MFLNEMSQQLNTLSIDIGGTGLKLIVLDANGNPLCDRKRIETPHPATPKAVLESIEKLSVDIPEFQRISVGFPGVIRNGVVGTAVNLDPQWPGTKLENQIKQLFNKPTLIANDADVQGFGCIDGIGLEMVLTLGTGMGSSLFINGVLVPNLELAHHPLKKGTTYEDYVGRSALEKIGKEKWIEHVKHVVDQTNVIWNWDLMHLGGGNTKVLKNTKFPDNVKLHSNKAGVLGGFKLWQSQSIEK